MLLRKKPPPEVAKEVLFEEKDAPNHPLSEREVEVLCLVARAFTAKKIAAALSIRARTVDRHKANIMHKLQIRSSVGLTLYAIRNGLVEA